MFCRLGSLFQAFDGIDDNMAASQEKKGKSGNSGLAWPLGLPELTSLPRSIFFFFERFWEAGHRQGQVNS